MGNPRYIRLVLLEKSYTSREDSALDLISARYIPFRSRDTSKARGRTTETIADIQQIEEEWLLDGKEGR